MNGDVLLTVKEYALLFRKHPDSVYRRIKQNTFTRFPLERDGRNVLIMVPFDLVERLQKRQKQPTPADTSRSQ
jgi:hypothetical protein